jgi:hypothetical protein
VLASNLLPKWLDTDQPPSAFPPVPQGLTCTATDVDTAEANADSNYPAPAWVTITPTSEIFIGKSSFTIAQCADSYTIPVTASLTPSNAPSAFIPGTDMSFTFRLYGVQESMDDYQFNFCDLTCDDGQTPTPTIVAYDCWTDLSSTVGNPAQFGAPSGGDPFSSIDFTLTMPSFGTGSCVLTVGATFDGALARRLEGTDENNMSQWEILYFGNGASKQHSMLRGNSRRAAEQSMVRASLRLGTLRGAGAAPGVFPGGAEPAESKVEVASRADRLGSYAKSTGMAILIMLVLLSF